LVAIGFVVRINFIQMFLWLKLKLKISAAMYLTFLDHFVIWLYYAARLGAKLLLVATRVIARSFNPPAKAGALVPTDPVCGVKGLVGLSTCD
jgi:hypothetical protein